MTYLPSILLKANIRTLAPVLTCIVNLSIESSTVPKVMKHAVVTPLLKKSRLDPDSLSNYRPISNLSFISKLLEGNIASQIRQWSRMIYLTYSRVRTALRIVVKQPFVFKTTYLCHSIIGSLCDFGAA